jgi:hypothetical protein
MRHRGQARGRNRRAAFGAGAERSGGDAVERCIDRPDLPEAVRAEFLQYLVVLAFDGAVGAVAALQRVEVLLDPAQPALELPLAGEKNVRVLHQVRHDTGLPSFQQVPKLASHRLNGIDRNQVPERHRQHHVDSKSPKCRLS